MADEAPSELLSRRHQMFPVLSEADMARMRRFGSVHTHPTGTRLISAGEPGPGMFVLLKGAIAVSQRDGRGRVTPIVQHGRGHFMGEVGSLSGKPSLVDGVVTEDAEVLLPGQLRALIIAEADLGERLVRALILRRVPLIEAGASGPVLIGQPGSADLLRLQNFLRRNGVFLFVGADPETRWLEGCKVTVDAQGFVLTGSALGTPPDGFQPAPLESSIPGVFAVGDVRSGSVKRVGGAVGEGAAAVAQIHRYLAMPGTTM